MLLILLALLLQSAAPPARATISGQLTLNNGAPAGAVRVVAIPAPPPTVRPAEGQNYYASQAPVGVALTDAEGRYQITNVPEGRYYIVAGIVGSATYYPSTTDIDAATVLTPAAGATLTGIDFRMRTSPGSLVAGRITPGPFPDTPERAVLSGVRVNDLVDVPVREDGSFDFGRIPAGHYSLSFIPHPPGLLPVPFSVGESDVRLDMKRPPVHTVSGRIVVDNGPLPHALLGFQTERDYVRAAINPDGSFRARLHDAPYRASLDGMPVGYQVVSVRVGSRAATAGFSPEEAGRAGLVIDVRAPRDLPPLSGRIIPPMRARVSIRGPIVGSLEATTDEAGAFSFSALPKGLYTVTVVDRPEFEPLRVAVTTGGADVQIAAKR